MRTEINNLIKRQLVNIFQANSEDCYHGEVTEERLHDNMVWYLRECNKEEARYQIRLQMPESKIDPFENIVLEDEDSDRYNPTELQVQEALAIRKEDLKERFMYDFNSLRPICRDMYTMKLFGYSDVKTIDIMKWYKLYPERCLSYMQALHSSIQIICEFCNIHCSAFYIN